MNREEGSREARFPLGGRLQRYGRFAAFDATIPQDAWSELRILRDCAIARCAGSVGGEGGIRTPGTLASTSVFETDPFDHSGTSPGKNAALLEITRIERRQI